MSVSDDIRNVPRPVNTIVVDNGKDGPNRYAVRVRAGSKYIKGGNTQPINGKTIGHIVDHKFVPVAGEIIKSNDPDMLSYGSAAFVRSVSGDLLDDLLMVYPAGVAYQIMAIASLRVIRKGVKNGRLSTFYKLSYVSRYYPGIGISANTVTALLQKLGRSGDARRQFYRRRADSVIAEHHIAIDGMLVQDNSRVNDLSNFSFKARKRGCKEISVLYAYDIEAMEPVCAEVFPGNYIDASAYSSFIRDNDITKGIIVADKGFPPARIKQELSERPELHYLTPIKSNDRRIEKNNMFSYDGVLKGLGDDHVLYSKRVTGGGQILYAFRSSNKSGAVSARYLEERETRDDFSNSEYEKDSKTFGLIVMESDLDLAPEVIYRCYEDRWLLEQVFDCFKNDDCLDVTNVQNDFSVIGSEFINFIVSVLTCRLIRKARNSGLMDKMTYGELMEDLDTAWRKTDAPEDPSSDDGYWVHVCNYVFDEMEALGLSKPVPKEEPRRRGRPKKHIEPADAEKPVRKRGRPRKNA